MNHWRAACGESSQVRFGGGPTEKDSTVPRRRPTRLGGGPTEKDWQQHLAGGLPDVKTPVPSETAQSSVKREEAQAL